MKLGFIGIGHIATAVIEALCSLDPDDLDFFLSPRGHANATRLHKTYPFVHRMALNQLVVDEADIVFIAVRPSDAKPVLEDLSFRENQAVVSFVPFLQHDVLANVTAPAQQACRAIPLPTVVHHTCPIPLFNTTPEISALFSRIGQPLAVEDEEQLHVLWTLTGFITPFYDLLGELSEWSTSKYVDQSVANRYLADLFQSLSYAAQQQDPVDFTALSNQAATPNGMNEQAGHELQSKEVHAAYAKAADKLLSRFKDQL